MTALLTWYRHAPFWQGALALVAQNVLAMLLALGVGRWLARRYADRRVAPPPPPIDRVEMAAVLGCLVLNTVVTWVGLGLWRLDWVHFRSDVGLRAWLDLPLLLLVMDFAMYVLHRLAHHPWLFPLLHRLHHRYDRPSPLVLFVLNPAETLSFGGLWLAVILVYPFSWLAMGIYLTLNLLFGVIGHLGVEPFPPSWPRLPLLRNIAGSSFHARHHQDLGYNFGFYTLIWDRLFGTLRPDYWETFGQVPAWAEIAAFSDRVKAKAGGRVGACSGMAFIFLGRCVYTVPLSQGDLRAGPHRSPEATPVRSTTLLLACLLALPSPAAAPPAQRFDHNGDPLPPGAIARLGTTRLRHYDGEQITSVAFSPDGRLIASAGEPRVWLWDSSTGKRLRALRTASLSPTNGLSFSADGKLLAAGVSDLRSDNLFVWDVATGKRLRTFRGHGGGPLATAFANGGRTLVSVGSEGKVCWWDVTTGKRQREWDPLARQRRAKAKLRFLEFYHATLSPDGEGLAATVGWQTTRAEDSVLKRSVIVWSLATRREAWRFRESFGWGSCPAFSPDGGRLAVGWSTMTPTVYNAATGEARHSLKLSELKRDPFEGDLKEICHSAFSSDGKRLAVATRGFGVRLWDLRTGKRGRSFCPPHAEDQKKTTGILRVVLSPDGKRVAMGWRRKVWLWDTATGREVPTEWGHLHTPDHVQFSAAGRHLLSSSQAGELRCASEGIRWDARSWRRQARWEVARWWGIAVPYSPDHRLCVRRREEGVLLVCQRRTGKRVCKLALRYEGGSREGGFFSPNNQLLVMPTLDRPRKLWLFNATNGKRLGELPAKADEICFAFSPDNKAVAWFDEEGAVNVADTAGKKKWHLFGLQPGRRWRMTATLAFSPDGRYLASWERADSDVRIWDLRSGKQHRQLSGGQWTGGVCLAYSSDGHLLAGGGLGGANDVQLWEVDTGKQVRSLDGHLRPATALAFSPDGRLLASASADLTVLVWDLTATPPADLAPLWPALADEDAAKAHRALWRLVGAADGAVAILRRRLRPAAPPPIRVLRRIPGWLAELDDDDFDVRERAFNELAELEHFVENALRKALAAGPAPEARSRLRQLLKRLELMPVPPQERQALRAAQALKHIGTLEARRLLRALAGGLPSARLTRQARESLLRLANRPPASP